MAAGYAGSAVATDFSTVPSATCVYRFSYKTDTRYVTRFIKFFGCARRITMCPVACVQRCAASSAADDELRQRLG